ncbi:MAG: hypothetical protein NT031_09990 [Planctomycetota bacterium]|nr:hypothetical protein [Planctomycetota bacterium]
MSGRPCVSQAGGAHVGVPITVRMPLAASRSMARSIQSKWNTPSAGSKVDQANSPTLATVMPASRIRRTSSLHRSSGQCSG